MTIQHGEVPNYRSIKLTADGKSAEREVPAQREVDD